MDENQRHRIRLSLERLIRLYGELRTEQVELMWLIGHAVDKPHYWLMAQTFGLSQQADADAFILRVIRAAGLRVRDIEPRCDVRPCSAKQQRAIMKLGGKQKDYTYSQAEQVIRQRQRKDSNEQRSTKRQRQS